MARMTEKTLRDQPRPTLDQLDQILKERGWTPSAGRWEDERKVYCFSQESYPGTYGGAAAACYWSEAGGWLSIPESKPAGVRFV